jgi:hypothetical protein
LSARHKLNVAAVNGALVIAAVIGLAATSWPVFLVVLAVLIVGSLHDGGIRPAPRNRR